ncbi:MAG: glycosyltransferase [Lachnospiraceae bacterium]|nr:glycosyltransferase [Lachnospiraceae bacterium]
MPKITALLPLYNGKKYIDESIRSIQAQTFSDWELLIVNDFGSDDGCAEIVLYYAEHDLRIRLVQNEKRLGLAESLNAGIRLASGSYIARVDVDDPSYPQRFEKQVDYMNKHPDVFLCGTLQRSVLPDRNYVLQVATDSEELKAAMLFGCEISHCSVMFRRDIFVRDKMRYNPQKLGEDYDLWTRIMFDHRLVNLPEVLVDHRWGFENISLNKGNALIQEVREISARLLKQFDIDVPKEDLILLSGWRNKPQEYAVYNKASFLHKQAELLLKLYHNNTEKKLIAPGALRKTIWNRWNWACECCNIFYQKITYDSFKRNSVVPKVSIVLPVCQAVETLRETIDSILVQEFTEWELLMVFEPEDSDGSFELAQMYAFMDSRIRIIENSTYLGLADSLNEGIRQAKSDYIARIDADDLANAKRVGAQYHYMEYHPNVGICQTYQHYFGGGRNDFVHKPPIKAEEMKAKLLFFLRCMSFYRNVSEKYVGAAWFVVQQGSRIGGF